MTNNNKESIEGGWGGPWTEKKLDAFIKYVQAYLTIMKKYHWKVIYFDGFAGSGERKAKPHDETELKLWSEFDISEEEENVYHGAAERVVRLQKPYDFDYYYFIDKDPNNIEKLKARLGALKEKGDKRLEFRDKDCNVELTKLANALKSRSKELAALAFIDPFGMQVDWKSIAQFAETRSDVWILLPTGVIVNRLLDRKGQLKYINKLESFFGMSEEEIRKHFYQSKIETTLFEEREIVQKISDPINKIAQIYIENMQKAWKYVTKKPLRLDNTKGCPIFHFVFASNNASALKIASQIISKL